jgi:2'-5' RNA ligase
VALTVCVPLVGDHARVASAIAGQVHTRLAPGGGVGPPHLSLAVLLAAPEPELVDSVAMRVAQHTAAFSVRSRGCAVFADEHDQLTLYTPVVRTDALAALHRELFDEFVAAGCEVDGHYHPEGWIPHVTLCGRTLEPRVLGEVIASTAALRTISWRLRVETIARLGPGHEFTSFALAAG